MKKETSIVFTGDIGFDRYMGGKWTDEELISEDIKRFLYSADHVAANVEGALIREDEAEDATGKGMFFHTMDPAAVQFLDLIRADIWNFANNHTLDAGLGGIASGISIAPEKGVSAIVAASRAIDMMRERGLLGAVGEYCASNVGRIEGGGATNVVPEACAITGECRAIDKDAVERVRDGMDACMHEGAQECGAAVEVDWTLEYPGYLLSDDAPAVQLFNRAVEAVGLQPSVYKSTGGTDANIYASSGVDPLVVSTGMADFHSVSEHLAVADLENTARIAIALARV